MKYVLEIAVSDFSGAEAAVAGGADRIELCANLTEGGVTPSLATIKKCRERFQVLLYPIIRPRAGDFLYTKDEFDIMLNDVKLCKQLGCDGIVTGLLNMDGTLDIIRTEKLIEAAYPMGVTFHRAFDRCRNPFEALEQLIEIGCERILTSGQKVTAEEGIECIAALQKQAGQRIIIMPGSGIRPENIKQIQHKTGCTEFHASLRVKTQSRMQFIHPSFAGHDESYSWHSVTAANVTALRQALEN
ncbi:MAG: copper homeostasis protein CutC [Chitinophagaceae bacterium]|nr:copper homeostasis protein CutC [Chitinophagaceae bacterium]